MFPEFDFNDAHAGLQNGQDLKVKKNTYLNTPSDDELISRLQDPIALEKAAMKLEFMTHWNDITTQRTKNILFKLIEALPFKVLPSKTLKDAIKPVIFSDLETVRKIRYLGDAGGIAVELEDKVRSSLHVISITHFNMEKDHPLRKKINEYKQRRIKNISKTLLERS